MKILIIEDEALAAKRLVELITMIDDTINIVGVVDSIEQGVEWLAENPSPELIFSDIELADGVSFEIFKQVKVECPIIFCTAYNQYTMEAFEINAISYILKPISREQVAKALEKFHSMREIFTPKSDTIEYNTQIEGLLKLIGGGGSSQHYKSTLMMNAGEKIIPISVNDIAYIYATTSGLQITTTKGQEFGYSSTLDELEGALDDKKFFRASRQFIVPRWSIHSIERYFNRTLTVKLNHKTPETVNVSRLKAKKFLEWMEM